MLGSRLARLGSVFSFTPERTSKCSLVQHRFLKISYKLGEHFVQSGAFISCCTCIR